MEYERFLEKLKKERKRKGVSLRVLGEKLGVTGQYISMWENNRTSLKMKDYFSICQVLEISPIELLKDETIKIEQQTIEKQLNNLPERDLKIIKKLIMVMGYSQQEL